MLDRRTVVAGIAGALPAAALGTPALGSPAIAQLIERHRAAWQAFGNAVDAYDNDVSDDQMNPAYFVAWDAEHDALLALCSYHCGSIEEAAAKAGYLLTAPGTSDDGLQREHVAALLQSFALPAA